MRKVLLVLICFLLLSNLATAQADKCTLKHNQLALVRGVRLGMTKKQVLLAYPKLKLSKPDFNFFNESADGIIKRASITNPLYQKNIESIYFSFYDENLSAFTITYDDSITWDSPKEFADQIARTLKLSSQTWRESKAKSGEVEGYSLSCADFSAHASIPKGKNPYLIITRTLDEWLEGNDKKKKEFKP